MLVVVEGHGDNRQFHPRKRLLDRGHTVYLEAPYDEADRYLRERLGRMGNTQLRDLMIALSRIEGVVRVTGSATYVLIFKSPAYDWEEMKAEIEETFRRFWGECEFRYTGRTSPPEYFEPDQEEDLSPGA